MINLFIGLTLLLIAQTLTWFGTNGQFIYPWFKENPFLLSIIVGTSSCYLFILATKYCSIYFDNDIWPIRILSFCIGIGSFAVLTWVLLHETPSAKTITCLTLAFVITLIQILWK